MELNDFIGKTMVGYRYGQAPDGGRSWNSREGEYEPGVSMAQWLYMPEVNSFAVWESSTCKKYYYVGVFAGIGGDDEICLKDVKRIPYREYCKMRKESQMVKLHNEWVNYKMATQLDLLYAGWHIGYSEDEIIDKYTKLLRKIK